MDRVVGDGSVVAGQGESLVETRRAAGRQNGRRAATTKRTRVTSVVWLAQCMVEVPEEPMTARASVAM